MRRVRTGERSSGRAQSAARLLDSTSSSTDETAPTRPSLRAGTRWVTSPSRSFRYTSQWLHLVVEAIFPR